MRDESIKDTEELDRFLEELSLLLKKYNYVLGAGFDYESDIGVEIWKNYDDDDYECTWIARLIPVENS